jgi:hypothetical protein
MVTALKRRWKWIALIAFLQITLLWSMAAV